MKFSLALLAATATANDDKKYINKPNFMSSSPPRWWGNMEAEDRIGWIGRQNRKLFKLHFDGGKPQEKLQPLFADLIDDAGRIYQSCSAGSRKRRAFTQNDPEGQEEAVADEGDPMVEDPDRVEPRRMSGDIEKDNKKLTLNLARFIKYNIYDQGGECEFLGHRLVSHFKNAFSLFLRTRIHYFFSSHVPTVSDGT